MSRLRFQPTEWGTHFITQRNLMGYSLMRPTPRTNAIIAGCLGYSLKRFKGVIELHAHVFLSNHYHMILSAYSQRDLSAFMSHFNGCLGKELGVIHDRHGSIWHRRYSASLILDEGALEDRYRYLLAHSLKEDLVEHPSQWPGLHAYKQLCMGQICEGIWIDRTAFYHARQRAKADEPAPTEAEFTSRISVELSGPPPLWGDVSHEAYLSRCQEIALEVIEAHKERRKAEKRRVLGAKGVLRQPVFQERFTRRTPCPLCHTRVVRLWREFRRAYRRFVAEFKVASMTLRVALACGEPAPPVCFPEGGVPLFASG